MEENSGKKYFAPCVEGIAKIEDVYIRNALLNKIILSIDGEPYDAENNSNIEKKRKKLWKSLEIDDNAFKDEDGKHNIYPLEIAAIIIAYFQFPPRTKEMFPMKVMTNRLRDVSGKQLLAFLHLASDISLILFDSLTNGKGNKAEERSYAFETAIRIEKYWKKYKEQDLLNYDEHPYKDTYYGRNSKQFNKLVMYANIKAFEDTLHERNSELSDAFLAELFAYKKDRKNEESFFEALNLIQITENVTEADVHTVICSYTDKMANYSQKMKDIAIIWKRIVASEEWEAIDDTLKVKGETFGELVNYFDRPYDRFYSVYDTIKQENGEDYMDKLYKAGLEYVKAYHQKIHDAYAITDVLISEKNLDQDGSERANSIRVSVLLFVIHYIDSPYNKEQGLTLYEWVRQAHPKEYMKKLTDKVVSSAEVLQM